MSNYDTRKRVGPVIFQIFQDDFEGAARRMKLSFEAGGIESPAWQELEKGLAAWAIEFLIHLMTRADFVVGQPLLGFAGSGLEAHALRAAREAFTQASGLDVLKLAQLNRQHIEWQALAPGWNLSATSLIARRKADTDRWALFSPRCGGEQVTEWQTSPAACYRPARLANGWFWVWNTEQF